MPRHDIALRRVEDECEPVFYCYSRRTSIFDITRESTLGKKPYGYSQVIVRGSLDDQDPCQPTCRQQMYELQVVSPELLPTPGENSGEYSPDPTTSCLSPGQAVPIAYAEPIAVFPYFQHRPKPTRHAQSNLANTILNNDALTTMPLPIYLEWQTYKDVTVFQRYRSRDHAHPHPETSRLKHICSIHSASLSISTPSSD